MQRKNKILIMMLMLTIFLSSFANADLTTSLISYYTMDNNSIIDEVSGLDGTNNGASVTNGKINYSMLFSPNDNIALPNAGFPIGDNSRSVCLWTNITTPNTNTVFFEQGTSGVKTILRFYKKNTGLLSVVDDQTVWSGSNLSINTIYFACFTYNSVTSNLTLYLDGNYDTSHALAYDLTTSAGNENNFGVQEGATSNFMYGWLDEIGIWNRTLTSTEITELYNSGNGLTYPFISGGVSYHRVKVTNKWNSSNLQGVNVTLSNGVSNLTQSDGIAYFSNFTGNLTFTGKLTNYFNITGTAQENQTVNYEMYQSQVNLSVYESFSGDAISNVSISVNSSVVINTTNSWGLIYPNVGTYTVDDVIDNSGDDTYHVISNSFTVNALDNISANVSVHQHYLNVTATNLLTGNPITSFTVNISSYNRTDNRQNITTNNKSIFNVIHDTYLVTIDAPDYALYNYTSNVTITADTEINFNLYTTNSLNITFYDIQTNTILNTINITVEFIGATAQTNITDTGTLFVDLFNPSEYTIIYSAPGYRQGSYILTVTNRSWTPLNLYLENSSITSLVLITVKDKFSKDPIQDAIVTVQRYLNNSWATEQILKTDFNGQTEGYFILSTEFYNFLVDVDDTTYFGIINSNENKKVIYAEDVSNGITIEIDTSPDTVIPNYQSTYSIVTSLTFTNTSNRTGYFVFYFDDTDNIQHYYELNVSLSNVLNCSNSQTTDSGSVICYVNISDSTDITYFTASGFIDGILVQNKVGRLGTNQAFNFNWGATGWFIGLFSVIIGFAMFLTIPMMSILTGTGVFVLLILFNVFLAGVGVDILLLVMFLAYLLARIPSNSGGNA